MISVHNGERTCGSPMQEPLVSLYGRRVEARGAGRAVADEDTSVGAWQTGVRARARAGIRTWPVACAQWGWNGVWPQVGFAVPARVRAWAAAEIGAGRLFPWFAVAFGSGIVLYFAADHEPAWWAAVLAAAIAAIAVIFLR